MAPPAGESELGRGRVLLLTTTVDRDWTDLPIRPGFLPLMQEAARWLAGAPSGDAISTLLVGAAREIPAATDDRRIEIIKPGGEGRALAPEARDTGTWRGSAGGEKFPGGRLGRVVVFGETDQPGSYRVRAFRTNGAWVDRPDETFVVNLDTRESDPKVLPPERRPDRASSKPGQDDRAPIRQLELWHVLAWR